MSNIGLELALRDVGHRSGPLPGGRQVRHGRDAQPRHLARRRAVGPRHFLGSPVHRATASRRRSTCSASWPKPDASSPIWRRSSWRIPRCWSTSVSKERRDLRSIPEVAAVMQRIEGAPGRRGTPAGPLLRHRAAAARDDRGQGSGRDPGVGRGDRRRRHGGTSAECMASRSTSTRSPRSAIRGAAACPPWSMAPASAWRRARPASRFIRAPTSGTSGGRTCTRSPPVLGAVARSGRVQHRRRSTAGSARRWCATCGRINARSCR